MVVKFPNVYNVLPIQNAFHVPRTPVMDSDVHCCAVGKYTVRCVITQLLCTLPVPGSLKATTAFQQVVDIVRISRARSKQRTACNRRVTVCIV